MGWYFSSVTPVFSSVSGGLLRYENSCIMGNLRTARGFDIGRSGRGVIIATGELLQELLFVESILNNSYSNCLSRNGRAM